MVDSIKITALQDIGANIAYTTLVPVVNMAGTPTTQKSNLQNLGNLILNGAGGSYFPRAAQATLALSVANAAQPNITSVGTLTSLAVTGNITAGNINGGNIVVANFYYGDGGFLTNVASGANYSNSNVANYLPTYTGNVGAGNISITGISNLGAVGNVRITGGTSGQKLTTDGAGNLSWTNDANSSYGNSNVAAYLPTYTGNLSPNNVNVTGNLYVSSLVASNANVIIAADADNINARWTFTQGGALEFPAPPGILWAIEPNIDDEFEIRSTSNVVISTDISNSNSHFTFDSDGIFTAPSNVNLLGSRLNVGPDAASAGNLLNPTLVIANTGAQYIQAAIINNDGAGSSDWSADGAGGGDDEAWTDMGFAGFSFNDANFTITEPGDGYLFVQAYANGLGGNMVLATGDHSNTADIIFATGGFLANAEFARIDHANDVFHLTRANSGIRFADGTTQTTAASGGVSSELVNGSNSLVLDGDGNIVLEGTPSGNAINRGLVWDYGANANGVNSTLRQDNGGLTVRAWTENGGGANGYSAPVSIVTNQDAAEKNWIFDGQGNLNVPSGSINSINDGGDLGAYITLTPDLGLTRLAARDAQTSVNYTNTSWSTATYTGTQVDFTNAPDLVSFFNENQFNVGVNQTFSINGGEPVPFTGYTIGVSNAVTVYTDVTPEPDPTTVTSIDFLYQLESYVAIDYDGGELNINATGLDIIIDNDQTEGTDIVLRSGDDISLQAKDMSLGSEREGGDINLNAGDGADDDGLGNTASGGGDIIIDAGIGGDGNSSSGGTGGFTQIRGGRGGTAGITNLAGGGGYVEIGGGDGGFNNSNTALGASGGDVNIYGGDTTREGFNGASVYLTSGAGGANAFAGSVNISTPSSDEGPGGLWQFDGNGLLTLPDGAIIDTIGNNFEVRAVENVNFEANAVVNIYTDGSGNAYQWQFGDDGNLTLPGNTFAVNYANGTAVTFGAAALGNVTFDDVTVQGVNGLNLSAGSDFTANLAYLQVRAGDVASHIHLDTGNNEAYDLIVGDDQNYVQVSSTGNILLSSYDSNTAQYTWTLDYNGNLILAGGNSVIQSIANSSLDPLNPNVSTMVLTPDPGYGSQALVLDPTAPGHIHLRAFSPSDIDAPAANIFLGGEDTSFEVTQGINNQAVIHSGGYDWTFGNDGNLTLPGNIVTPDGANAVVPSTAGTAGAPLIISAGTGGDAATSLNAGNGGNLTINAGDAGSDIGNPSWGAIGGTLVLRAGNSTQPYTGSNVEIRSGNSASIPGAISLYTGANQWTFDATGNLTVPGSLINDTSIVLASPAVFNICTISTAGSGYNTGSSLKATTGGSGTGMTVGIGYGLSNQLTSVTVVDPGTGYVNGDVITVSEGTGGTFVLTKYNQSANQTNNNTVQTDFTFANSTVTLPIYGEVATDASMTLTTNLANTGNTRSWTFGDDGRLTFPGTPRIDTDADNFEVQAAEAINFEANTVVNIYTDAGNNAYQWQFGDDGSLTLPDTTSVIANASITLEANSTGNITGLSVNGDADANLYAHGNVKIVSDSSNTTATWAFDNAGNLTLPTGGQIIVSGGLVSSGASPAPSINGFSITNSVGISGNGNIAGNNISATGTLTATGKIGYASGSTVTQITSRGTSVTINALAGTIVTTSVAMVANEIDTFSVINSSVDPNNDIVLAQIVSPNQGTYNCIANPAVIGGFSNGFYINIVNISGFTTADETITVRFMVIKAPNA